MEPMPSSSCLQHGRNPVTGRCGRCGRPICELCTFSVGAEFFCPECLSAGPSADERSSVRNQGLASIGLALLTIVFMIALLVLGALGLNTRKDMGVALAGLGILQLASCLGGTALSLIAREGAARTGSVLPTIGLVFNAVMLALTTVFAVIGNIAG